MLDYTEKTLQFLFSEYQIYVARKYLTIRNELIKKVRNVK